MEAAAKGSLQSPPPNNNNSGSSCNQSSATSPVPCTLAAPPKSASSFFYEHLSQSQFPGRARDFLYRKREKKGGDYSLHCSKLPPERECVSDDLSPLEFEPLNSSRVKFYHPTPTICRRKTSHFLGIFIVHHETLMIYEFQPLLSCHILRPCLSYLC